MATNAPPTRLDVAPDARGPLDRALGLFADVRAGEGRTAVLLTLNVFLLLTCYYLLKTAREPLILASGAEVKSYSSAGQAVLLVFFTQAYGAIAERVGRMRLITIVTLFFASNLVDLLRASGSRDVPVGVPFFLWVGIFNYMIIAQFWSFAADIYTEEQGKRLFAILGIGSTRRRGRRLGDRARAHPADRRLRAHARRRRLAPRVPGVVTFIVESRARSSATHDGEVARRRARSERGRASRMLFATVPPPPRRAALLINWVNSNGEYILDRTLLAGGRTSPPEPPPARTSPMDRAIHRRLQGRLLPAG